MEEFMDAERFQRRTDQKWQDNIGDLQNLNRRYRHHIEKLETKLSKHQAVVDAARELFVGDKWIVSAPFMANLQAKLKALEEVEDDTPTSNRS